MLCLQLEKLIKSSRLATFLVQDFSLIGDIKKCLLGTRKTGESDKENTEKNIDILGHQGIKIRSEKSE